MPSKQSTPKPTKNPQNSNPCCFICLYPIEENENSIKCSRCSMFAHLKCMKISKAMAQFIQEASLPSSLFALPLLCPSCKPLLDNINLLQERVNSIESRLASLDMIEAQLKSLNTTIASLKNDDIKQKSAGPSSQKTIPPQNPQPQPHGTSHTTDISILIKDAVEREQKRPNAILFGLEDNSETDDISRVHNIVRNFPTSTISPEEILNISRDGPEYKNTDGTIAPRFCRVICINETSKRKFIHTINTIARNVSVHNKLRSRPDLSMLQRVRSRELRAELKRRLDRGETNLYIDYRSDCIKPKTNGMRPYNHINPINNNQQPQQPNIPTTNHQQPQHPNIQN